LSTGAIMTPSPPAGRSDFSEERSYSYDRAECRDMYKCITKEYLLESNNLQQGSLGRYKYGSGEEPPPTSASSGTESPHSRTRDRLVHTVLKAKAVTDHLQSEYLGTGDMNPTLKTVEVLQAALAFLGYPAQTSSFVAVPDDGATLRGSPPVMLAHPDEFKNPSSFLKIYGDPLCFVNQSNFPKKARNGNWECAKCRNINYPRRFRCNKCCTLRDAEGDRIVSDYTRHVYTKYLLSFRGKGTHVRNQYQDPCWTWSFGGEYPEGVAG